MGHDQNLWTQAMDQLSDGANNIAFGSVESHAHRDLMTIAKDADDYVTNIIDAVTAFNQMNSTLNDVVALSSEIKQAIAQLLVLGAIVAERQQQRS